MKFVLAAGLVGMVFCGDNIIDGPGNVVVSGQDNHIRGRDNTVDGWKNDLHGDFNDIEGNQNDVSGDQNFVEGDGNLVIGSDNLVIGAGNFVTEEMSTYAHMNLGKYLQREQPYAGFGPNQFFGRRNIPMMMGNRFQQNMMEKMEAEMEERFKQMKVEHFGEQNQNNVFGSSNREI